MMMSPSPSPVSLGHAARMTRFAATTNAAVSPACMRCYGLTASAMHAFPRQQQQQPGRSTKFGGSLGYHQPQQRCICALLQTTTAHTQLLQQPGKMDLLPANVNSHNGSNSMINNQSLWRTASFPKSFAINCASTATKASLSSGGPSGNHGMQQPSSHSQRQPYTKTASSGMREIEPISSSTKAAATTQKSANKTLAAITSQAIAAVSTPPRPSSVVDPLVANRAPTPPLSLSRLPATRGNSSGTNSNMVNKRDEKDDDDCERRRKRARKSVHFELKQVGDEEEATATTACTTVPLDKQPTIYLTPEEIQNSWWNEQENEDNYQSAKEVAIKFRSQHSQHTKAFIQCFARSIKPQQQQQNRRSQTRDFQSLLKQQESCRGMERAVHPILTCHRAKYIQAMMKLQRSGKKYNNPRTLSIRSQQLSRPSRVLASQLAHHDNQLVLEMVREELERVVGGSNATK